MKSLVKSTSYFWGCVLFLSACAADSNSQTVSRNSDPALSQALHKIEVAYIKFGRGAAFEDLIKDYDASLRTCKQGLVVDFLPKGADGLDGDYSILIDKDTDEVSDLNLQPYGCLSIKP